MALNIQRLNFDAATGDNPSEAWVKLDLNIGEIAAAIDGDGGENPGIEGRLTAVETTVGGLGDAATKDVGTGAGTVAAGDDSRFTDNATAASAAQDAAGEAKDAADNAQDTADAAQSTANAAMPKAGGGFTGPITVTSANTNLAELIGSGAYTGQFYTNGVVRWLAGASNFTTAPAGITKGAYFIYEWPNSVQRFAIAPNNGPISMTGNVNVSATLTAVAVTQTSSFDVKENIHAFDGALEIIDRISVVTFTYDKTFLEGDEKTRLGVLAENIEVSMPSAYTPSQTQSDDQGEETIIPASVDYAQFGPLAIRAIQELRSQLDALQARVAQLEGA